MSCSIQKKFFSIFMGFSQKAVDKELFIFFHVCFLTDTAKYPKNIIFSNPIMAIKVIFM